MGLFRRGALAALTISAAAVAACGDREPAPRPGPSQPAASGTTATPSAPAVLQTRSETRQFRDWSATCSNDGTCWAFGFAPDFAAGWVRIALPPGPDARPEVAFGYWPDSDAPASTAVGLQIDDRAFPATLDNGGQTPVGRIRSDTIPLIDAMAQGRSMTIKGATTQAVSLNGAAAALLWIDEKQGRLGTTTALIRRGDRPASSVPVAPPLPTVPVAPRIDQTGFGDSGQTLPATLRARREVGDCLKESQMSGIGDGVSSARLDARTVLWAVACGSGAYNLTHFWYLTGPDGREPRPVALVGTAGPGANPVMADNTTINGAYDPETRTLSAFAKGRGIGDCGALQTWAWTGDRFALTRESSMGNCAGVPNDLWPVAWRTR
ncbi:DUF1176 domain-containing protein [Brevundimonas intermedia]|uniref:DUF1176 domain-containing protein n=1 Tax=Brevundimonas intermedia TaxID=74315 RepID=UPI0022F2926E|nr:DUF1176 domain-containing protein [Brevundimonas intermedia]